MGTAKWPAKPSALRTPASHNHAKAFPLHPLISAPPHQTYHNDAAGKSKPKCPAAAAAAEAAVAAATAADGSTNAAVGAVRLAARPRTAMRDTDRAAVTVVTREPAHGHARTPPPTAGVATRNATAGDGRAPGDNAMTRGGVQQTHQWRGGKRGGERGERGRMERMCAPRQGQGHARSGGCGRWLGGRSGGNRDTAANERDAPMHGALFRADGRGRQSLRRRPTAGSSGGCPAAGPRHGPVRREGELNANGTKEQSGPPLDSSSSNGFFMSDLGIYGWLAHEHATATTGLFPQRITGDLPQRHF